MTDQEFNNQDSTTAGAIRAHNDATERVRRKTVNSYARAEGLIDDQEDLIQEYRGSGINKLRAVQSYVNGNSKDWEETQKAIDSIAKQQSGFWNTRRGFLAGLGVAGFGAASYLAGTGSESTGTGSVEYMFESPSQFEDVAEDAGYDPSTFVPEWKEHEDTGGPNTPDFQKISKNDAIVFDYTPDGNSEISVTWMNWDSGKKDYDEQTATYERFSQKEADRLATAAENLEGNSESLRSASTVLDG